MRPSSPVRVSTGTVTLPTWLPAPPDKNPMFLEKRVYQGSSGAVYPLPFTDRISEKPVKRKWRAVWIENEYIRALVLPEIGGRIHAILDKSNGYDLIYNQPVIKPALVGLAGPWISGGIEFNWPQHHRPAAFLPVDVKIESHPGGAKTVWCGDHDPMCRMKGMHGVRLQPGSSRLELKVRVYNRTPLPQTFLWWANAATRVHAAYQSFFPPDVYYVADHAKRAMSEYPLCRGSYYGVNYAERARRGVPSSEIPRQFLPPHCGGAVPVDYAPNDLSFYANIPVPTSYMCMGSREDFCGGYDYSAQAGLVHIANHHIAPGKKQWTWGNHEFGYAWDRNLTEPDAKNEFGPYIEIMAGAYTDNQPDFSFLQPGETKTWSQYWYPIQKIGPAQHANLDAAVSLRLDPKRFRFGVSVTRAIPSAVIRLERLDNKLSAAEWVADLAPGKPFVVESLQARKPWKIGGTTLRVLDRDGTEILAYTPKPRVKGEVPPPATEPPAPENISGADELFITGLHLEQYRHATRPPVLYWREALRRDPEDCRCNNAMGLWHLKRGEFTLAEPFFRKAIARLTRRNPNPPDGAPFYNLGLCLRYLDRDEEAYDVFYKAVWTQAWMAAGYHSLAELDCRKSDWPAALEHLDRSLRFNTNHLRARNLKVMVLRAMDRAGEADSILRETLRLDPLDWWARLLHGENLSCDLPARLDLAHDLARAGFLADAIRLLQSAPAPAEGDLPTQGLGVLPMVKYTLGWLCEKSGDQKKALRHFRQAAALPPDYCFPSRLEDIAVLQAAMRANPEDARAPYYLGNLFYDRRRHAEAIRLWERGAKLNPNFSIVWRNLGLGCFNITRQPARARAAYDRAFQTDPHDARLLYERDQLWKRLGQRPAARLRELEKNRALVGRRDDLTVEFCALLNQTGRHIEAMRLLAQRKFQPWEGGEGAPLQQHVRTQLALGREALAQHDFPCAASHFEHALVAPENLGEARHLLANQSDVHYWAGLALEMLREKKQARRHWLAAAEFRGDFQQMRARAFSEMTFYSALALEKLGRKAEAKKLLLDLLAHARALQKAPAQIDYFATSLPAMLLFEDDLPFRQETAALFLQAQARLGLGQKAAAKALLRKVLRRDPSHAPAADLAAQIVPPEKS